MGIAPLSDNKLRSYSIYLGEFVDGHTYDEILDD